MELRRFLTGTLYCLSCVAVIQVIAALVSLAVQSAPQDDPPSTFLIVFVLAFSAAAAMLYRWSGDELRVRALGTSFFIAASSFAHPFVLNLFGGEPYGANVFARLVLINPVEPFLGMTTWLLVGNFPRTVRPIKTLQIVLPATFLISATIYAANVFYLLTPTDSPGALRVALENSLAPGLADVMVFGLAMISLPYCWWLNRYAVEQERRRVNLFMAGLGLGLGLPCVFILLTVIPAVNEWSYTPFAETIVIPSFQLLLLTIPFTTGYALIVDEVLSLSGVFRNSLRYLFAKWTIVFFTFLPLLLLLVYFYNLRNQTLQDIFTNPVVLLLVIASAGGFYTLRYRDRLQEAIDKRFFRQSISAAEILSETITQIPRATNIQEQCTQTIARIDEALHPETIKLFLLNVTSARYTNFTDTDEYIAPESPLIAEISDTRQALSVAEIATLEVSGNTSLQPESVAVFIPLQLLSGQMIGFFILGPKRSGLDYSAAEIALLSTIGVSTALALETQDFRSSRQPQTKAPSWTGISANDQSHLLRICASCGRAITSAEDSCCGADVEVGTLPALVNGRFQIERRLGKGTMGEVYLATDIGLERRVALKTLTSASSDAQLLQLESKASAAVQHENLAAIHDIQWCYGVPVLIFELLENGTLESRLKSGPLSISTGVELGTAIARALKHLHQKGIWHQDIKPGNIGFDRDNTPKLLDFGLANRQKSAIEVVLPSPADLQNEFNKETLKSTYSNKGLVGTPLYWAPEILSGQQRTAAIDVWALCVVLYEAIAGKNPVERASWPESYRAIVTGDIQPLRDLRPDCPQSLADVIMQGLAVDSENRLAEASELLQRLNFVAERL